MKNVCRNERVYFVVLVQTVFLLAGCGGERYDSLTDGEEWSPPDDWGIEIEPEVADEIEDPTPPSQKLSVEDLEKVGICINEYGEEERYHYDVINEKIRNQPFLASLTGESVVSTCDSARRAIKAYYDFLEMFPSNEDDSIIAPFDFENAEENTEEDIGFEEMDTDRVQTRIWNGVLSSSHFAQVILFTQVSEFKSV